MRDDQVRRYARHILLPDLGGHGQTALLAASAAIELPDAAPEAALICAQYLAAGGVGTIVLRGASAAQLASVAAYCHDTRLTAEGTGQELGLPVRPGWWPEIPPAASAASTAPDATALAFWRGGLAAVRWMADVAHR